VRTAIQKTRRFDMFVYLVQHAESKSEQEDPERSLSEQGMQNIRKVSSFASQCNLKIHMIFHSPKLRAKQTAEVLSEYFNPEKGVSEVDGLKPLDDPSLWAQRLKDIPEDVILVGHLPHLDKLTSLLLCGDKDKNVISFKMAGIVCLERADTESYALQWMVTPQILS
jgi:phosphohistidine phosphatase